MSIIQEERRRLRSARRSLLPQAREQAALALLTQVKLSLLLQAEKVALYMANDGEIDPIHLIRQLWMQGKQCYLPVMEANNQKILRFARYTSDSQMRVNHVGIEEPLTDYYLSVQELDLIFLPLVAFDLHGHRLGRGGGFYDATLAEVRSTPRRIGLAYDFQRVDLLPKQEHDVMLHAVVTDKQYYEMNQ